jgi:hypothetical protein
MVDPDQLRGIVRPAGDEPSRVVLARSSRNPSSREVFSRWIEEAAMTPLE